MDAYPLLSHISSPHDVKKLSDEQLLSLCAEIRLFLISSLSKTGGHLASNLGIVEIATAIESVFSSPDDKIIYDVGHQCYVHKLLTGRQDGFAQLRQFGGMSGFPRPDESPYDAFIGGHASMSISAALGMARARTLKHEENHVICVIGDGALTGGMAYEALNDAGQSGEPIIVIFNDNEMSISHNVGALSTRLSKIRIRPQYIRLKGRVKKTFRRFSWGEKAIAQLSAFKRRIRTSILKETIFELMGFNYWGPADGNDLKTVKYLLSEAKKLNAPVVLHFKTTKGKGYKPSEDNPGYFHGVSAFHVDTGMPMKNPSRTFSSVCGGVLTELAEENQAICAVTAAMKSGTGLSCFAQEYPKRFFDVGIAEEHAVTMCGGLAAAGMQPVCAIYSTFLQRAYDQMIHDVAISRLPVTLCVDRAGLVGEDGETHQGMFDVPYLMTIPNFKVYSPSSFAEEKHILTEVTKHPQGPAAIRYPRGGEQKFTADTFDAPVSVIKAGRDFTIITYGIMVNEALAAAELLEADGISTEIVKLNCLNRFDDDAVLTSVKKTKHVVILEDCCDQGCLGEKIEAAFTEAKIMPEYSARYNCGNRFLPAGKISELYQLCGIDGKSAAKRIQEAYKRG